MIEEKAKKVIEAVINDNEVAGLIDAVENILDVIYTTAPNKHREAIERLLDDLEGELVFLEVRDITNIEEFEQLVYAKRMYDAVQIYYDNMDKIGDVKECSIRDLKDEIIYYGGW